jgi:hypothetical protein
VPVGFMFDEVLVVAIFENREQHSGRNMRSWLTQQERPWSPCIASWPQEDGPFLVFQFDIANNQDMPPPCHPPSREAKLL